MLVQIVRGAGPIIFALPYAGSTISPSIYNRLNDADRSFDAVDAYLDRIVTGLDLNTSLVAAGFHWYMSDPEVPDPARALTRRPHYEGCVPLLTDRDEPIWHTPPDPMEALRWRGMFHAPYHAALQAQVASVRARQGFAVVITMRAAKYHENADETDIDVSANMSSERTMTIASKLVQTLKASSTYSCRLNGSLNAGWTTRNYSAEGKRISALQLVLNDRLYLTSDTEPRLYDAAKADKLIATLRLATATSLRAHMNSDAVLGG